MHGALLGLFLLLWVHGAAEAQLISPGKLAQDHAELEGFTNCTQCHTLGEKVPDGKCLACHETLAARIEAEKGYHATFTQTCVECHSDHRGRDYQLIRWEPEEFDHELAGYPLEEAHADLECKQCHTTESFLGLSQDCLSCHEDEHSGQLSTNCLDCHTFVDWQPVKFDHEQADFKLRGKHVELDCAQCHPDGLFKGIEFAQCSDCHEDQHRGQFAADCTSCHGVDGWVPSFFDHETARFKLRGKHVEVDCQQCHQGGLYRPLDFQDCSACHQDIHQPSLGTDCQRCHTVSGWTEASDFFDHQTTQFPLEGAHQQVNCEQCHQQHVFRGTPFAECRDCHEDYHEGQFTQDCASCHEVAQWVPSFFDHEQSRFKLRGGHVGLDCVQCHSEGHYKPMETACMACHTGPHQGQFADDCSACHTVELWEVADFDHDRTAFRLEGAHAGVACEKCHALETASDGSGFRRFKPLAMECQDCHQ
ncbi:MAG: hypothetical protein GKR89_14635 [Candidatus Latescibacteria bacterium]|nr:hypothetical protein [Candidatus Latescibacterota bacterium]